MSEQRLVIHHLDPRVPGIGGIDTCVYGMIRYGVDAEFSIVGMTRRSGSVSLGEWTPMEVEGRRVDGMYVGAISDSRRGVPNSVRLRVGVRRFSRAIRQANPDVVQVHRIEIAPALRRLFPTQRLELFIHEDAANWSRRNTESRWRRIRCLHRTMVKRAVESADRIVCFSPSAAHRLAQQHSHVVSVPTWYDPAVFHPGRPREWRNRIVWVGRLETVKDPTLALEVLSQLPSDYELTIVGDGSLSGFVADIVRTEGLERRVRLVGAVPYSEVAALMRTHDLLLITSHSEGFPRVMVEAMACGLPIVATAESDTGDLIEDGLTGYTSSDRSPEVLADLVTAASKIDPGMVLDAVATLGASVVVDSILRDSTS